MLFTHKIKTLGKEIIALLKNIDNSYEHETVAEHKHDLNVHWLPDNTLKIMWKHPNASKCVIKFFRIFLDTQLPNNTQEITEAFSMKPGIDQKFYYYQIEGKKIMPSTKYNIRIATDDGHLVQHLISEEIFSPPDIPVLVKGPLFSSTETTITVELLAKRKSRVQILIVDDNREGLLCEHEVDHWNNFSFTVGVSDQSQCNNTYSNPPLLPKKLYNITIVITSTNYKYNRSRLYSNLVETKEKLRSSNLGILLSVLFLVSILIIILGYLFFILYSKKKTHRNSTGMQNCEQEIVFFKNWSKMSSDNEYCNPIERRVAVTQFEDYVKTHFESGELLNQHQTILEKYPLKNYEIVKSNLFYDYVGVRFESIDLVIQKAYIISQMPQSGNVSEFWEMIWDEHVQNIIFIDNGSKDSTEKYWPDYNNSLRYHYITIQLLDCQIFTHYVHRKFIIMSQDESRQINQFYFPWWENAIPNSTAAFSVIIQKIKNLPLDANSPIVVQSRLGLKNTGFVLLCDMCIKTANKEGWVDVFCTAQNLTECRNELMGDIQHYLLAHLVILESILTSETMKRNQVEQYNVTEKEALQQYTQVTKLSYLDQYTSSIKREVQHPTLISYSANDEHEYSSVDKINSVCVDCFQRETKFIITRQPTTYDLYYFWNMVYEQDISSIVILNQNIPSEGFDWLPNDRCLKINIVKSIVLQQRSKRTLKGYTWSSITLRKHTRISTIDVFSLEMWAAGEDCPEDVSDFVNFCIETNVVLKGSTLVVCSDGITASGLFVTLLYNIQTINNKDSDICNSVRIIRSFHPKFIKNEEQFLFLWKASKRYLKEEEIYER